MKVPVQIGSVQFEVEAVDAEHYAMGILSSISGVPLKAMVDADLTDDQMRRLEETSRIIYDLPIFVGRGMWRKRISLVP